MLLRRFRSRPSTIQFVGMVFLVVGALSLRFLARVPGMNPDLADGISGLFYGMAIATLLTSVWLRRRSHDGRSS